RTHGQLRHHPAGGVEASARADRCRRRGLPAPRAGERLLPGSAVAEEGAGLARQLLDRASCEPQIHRRRGILVPAAGPAPLVGDITLDVSPERAWNVLTEPDYVVRWVGCLNYTGKIGNVFHMQQDANRRAAGDISGATHCEILALKKPE